MELKNLSDEDIQKLNLTQKISFGSVDTNSKTRWLIPWVEKRLREKRPVNLVYTGETGSGKSYAAMRTAENVDESFSEEHIVFDTTEFMKILNSKPPAGTVIMLDEAGVAISSKDWHTQQLILFGKTAQSMRYRGILIFYTVPRLPFVDATTRQLIQILFESTSVRGRMKPFFIRPAANRNDNRPWYYYPTRTVTVNFRSWREQIRIVNFLMPSKHIYIPYEKKKDEYLTSLYENFEDTLKSVETGKEELETGIVLLCPNCKYKFRYKKASWSPKCTRCGSPIDIPQKLKPYVGIQHVKLNYGYVMDPVTGGVVYTDEHPDGRQRNTNPDAPDVQLIGDNSDSYQDDDEGEDISGDSDQI